MCSSPKEVAAKRKQNLKNTELQQQKKNSKDQATPKELGSASQDTLSNSARSCPSFVAAQRRFMRSTWSHCSNCCGKWKKLNVRWSRVAGFSGFWMWKCWYKRCYFCFCGVLISGSCSFYWFISLSSYLFLEYLTFCTRSKKQMGCLCCRECRDLCGFFAGFGTLDGLSSSNRGHFRFALVA